MTFESFGFKYGPARDPDLMFDVRFLPNPHYEPTLRPLTGLDPRDRRVHRPRRRRSSEFYDRLHPLLDYLLPQYLAEGKAHLVVAIGCTGGRHRSVAIAQHLAERYQPAPEYVVQVDPPRHRTRRRDRPHRLRGHRPDAVGRASTTRCSSRSAARRMLESEHAIAYGVNGPEFWIVVRGRAAGARLRPRRAEGQRQGRGRRRLPGRAGGRRQRRRAARAAAAVRQALLRGLHARPRRPAGRDRLGAEPAGLASACSSRPASCACAS